MFELLLIDLFPTEVTVFSYSLGDGNNGSHEDADANK